jgi:hypothetical protein
MGTKSGQMETEIHVALYFQSFKFEFQSFEKISNKTLEVPIDVNNKPIKSQYELRYILGYTKK